MCCSSQGAVERWSVNQFAQIVHHQMRAMVPKLLGIPLACDADHKAEVPVADPASTPERASSMTTARAGSTPSSFAAIKNVSGAGFPAKCSGMDHVAIDLYVEEVIQLGGL